MATWQGASFRSCDSCGPPRSMRQCTAHCLRAAQAARAEAAQRQAGEEGQPQTKRPSHPCDEAAEPRLCHCASLQALTARPTKGEQRARALEKRARELCVSNGESGSESSLQEGGGRGG